MSTYFSDAYYEHLREQSPPATAEKPTLASRARKAGKAVLLHAGVAAGMAGVMTAGLMGIKGSRGESLGDMLHPHSTQEAPHTVMGKMPRAIDVDRFRSATTLARPKHLFVQDTHQRKVEGAVGYDIVEVTVEPGTEPVSDSGTGGTDKLGVTSSAQRLLAQTMHRSAQDPYWTRTMAESAAQENVIKVDYDSAYPNIFKFSIPTTLEGDAVNHVALLMQREATSTDHGENNGTWTTQATAGTGTWLTFKDGTWRAQGGDVVPLMVDTTFEPAHGANTATQPAPNRE